MKWPQILLILGLVSQFLLNVIVMARLWRVEQIVRWRTTRKR